MDFEIKRKADCWDYYQELVKASGFNGITDLLAENKRLKAIFENLNKNYDAIQSVLTDRMNEREKLFEESGEIQRLEQELYKSNIYNKELHTEIVALRAEKSRLQAIIDEANAQEPIAITNGEFGSKVSTLDRFIDAGQNLYVEPIPAQQSQVNSIITSGLRHKLIWLLWHHQGAKSDIGQPIRKLLGVGQFERLTDEQVEIAKVQHEVFLNHFSPVQPSPAVAVPEFLLEMSKQMREQNNRGTSHPFFQVRCKRYIVTEQGYDEHHWEIIGDDGVVYSSIDPVDNLYKYLYESHPDFVSHWNEENHVDDISEWFDPEDDDHFPEGLRRIYVQETEEIISTHLTEAAAYQFIARKQHDYPKLYTYAESAYWSPQLRQLQDWIISLSNTEIPSPRITEQDAREIAQNFMNWGRLNCSDSPADDWIQHEGRDMLNKLNNNQ